MFINAAGLQSLDIAHGQNLATDYSLLPIKGRYAISKDASFGDRYNMLVYPVPVKGAFVLGVHSTLAISGHLKLGPTAFPAFSPENYEYAQNLSMKGLSDCFKAYGRVALSSKTRGLIKHFIASELVKSVSIATLVAETSKYQSFGKNETPSEIVKKFEFYRAGIRA